ncbi:MAG: hypothetical protein KGH58_02740 [Candidatus Micrarchaeota archaeon]|nr:hypothetical protein [Candidatus Micrarchaeota archaeon]
MSPNPPKTGAACIAMIASPSGGLDMLLKHTASINDDGKSVIQVFDSKSVVSRRQLMAAYENAKARFSGGANRTRSMANEMLLFIALTNQINDAIKRAGAKEGSPVVVFASTMSAYSKIARLLDTGKQVAERSGSDASIFQKMALLQIEGS